jgi:hypothetical protein
MTHQPFDRRGLFSRGGRLGAAALAGTTLGGLVDLDAVALAARRGGTL